MSQTDRSRKLFVRSVLAGTSTLATLMGAQSLALIDSTPIDDEIAEETALQLTLMPTVATFPTSNAVPADNEIAELGEAVEPTIMKVEPSITIFRQAGSANTANNHVATTNNQQSTSVEVMSNTTPNNNLVIQPPSPVELAAPDPIVIVEQPPVQQQVVIQQQPQQQQQSQPQANKQKKSKKSNSGSSR